MACETAVLLSNRSFVGEIPGEFIFREDDPEDLARKIAFVLELEDSRKKDCGRLFRDYVLQNHDLETLISRMKRHL
jgi:hypothetical protein